MAGYNEIRGLRVKYLSDDPSNAENGQVWYNTSTSNLRVQGIGVSAWLSGANGIQARRLPGGFGTQTANVAVGGVGPNPTVFNDTEHYDGSGWSAAEDYPSPAYGVAGSGTQTSGLAWGGYFPSPGAYSNTSNTYNGSSWTSAPTLNTARGFTSNNIGTQTAALCAGGGEPLKAVTEEYNGSAWSESGDLSTARQAMAAGGTQTASFAAGGEGPAPGAVALTEEYNGTSWTAGGALNTARLFLSGTGPLTAGIAFAGGEPSNSNKTEKYDGTTWSVAPTLATARQAGMGAGANNTSALAAFGATGPTDLLSLTEEFNNTTNTITAAAFASSPALSYSVDGNLSSSGSLTSAVAAGGYNAPAGPGTVSYIANAATWNGTAWSNITDMPERRTNNNAVGATAPAFYVFGGQNQPGPSTNSYLTTTHTWNGSSWGSGPALAESQSGGGSCGTPSAIVMMGGVNAPSSGSIDDNIQQYDGSSWANSPVNYPSNVSGNGMCGTQTAAVSFGGYQGGSPFPGSGVTNTNEWNGSSISASNAMVFGLLGCSGSGTQTAALSYGGRNTAGNKNAIGMLYDGTSWATSPSLATARDYIAMGPMGSAPSCLAVAGSGGAQSLVEEFSSETSTAAPAQSITVS